MACFVSPTAHTQPEYSWRRTDFHNDRQGDIYLPGLISTVGSINLKPKCRRLFAKFAFGSSIAVALFYINITAQIAIAIAAIKVKNYHQQRGS